MLALLKRKVGPYLSSMVPISLWHQILKMNLIIPYYHIVNDSKVDHVSGLYDFRNKAQFIKDIDFFLKHYKPISFEDLLKYCERAWIPPHRCFFLTFDDGFQEVNDIIEPILSSKGVSAAFFLATSSIDNKKLNFPQKKSVLVQKIKTYSSSKRKKTIEKLLGRETFRLIEFIVALNNSQEDIIDDLGNLFECDFDSYLAINKPYLTTEQISSLIRKGYEIGAHSMTHPLYSRLSLDEQLEETVGSIQFLSERFKYKCRSFAFPYMDKGVTPEFFEKLFEITDIKITFSTGGMGGNINSKNLYRFTMERGNVSAIQTVTRQLYKSLIKSRKKQ